MCRCKTRQVLIGMVSLLLSGLVAFLSIYFFWMHESYVENRYGNGMVIVGIFSIFLSVCLCVHSMYMWVLVCGCDSEAIDNEIYRSLNSV